MISKFLTLAFVVAFSQTGFAQKVTSRDVLNSIKIEKALSRHYEVLPPLGRGWFVYIPGKSRVLVLAPHATAQVREGKVKKADTGTGSLAVMLNRMAGAPVLITTYESPSDPNYYDDNAFKDFLQRVIVRLKPRIVLDLHTSSSDRPYDIDFGTLHGKSLLGHEDYLQSLQDILMGEGFTHLSNNFFAAEKQQTDTKWVSNLGTPCIQTEINYNWLSPQVDVDHFKNFAHLLEGLVRFVQSERR